jgi:cytidylate kinase
MASESVTEREARRRIVEVEADRRAFLAKQFHADFAQPTDFDLVVNTSALGLDAACELVCAALARLPARRMADALAAGTPH